jgi:uncharacterized membrane protein YhaH (DUF805 family)
MTFTTAVVSCFRDNYARFSGRAERSEYWNFVAFNVLVAMTFRLLGAMTSGSPGARHLVSVLDILVALVTLPPTAAVAARRLHDTGRSGWWFLLPMAGLAGLLASNAALRVRLDELARTRRLVELGGTVPVGAPGGVGGYGVLLVVALLAFLVCFVGYLSLVAGQSGPGNEYGPGPGEFIDGLPTELGPLAAGSGPVAAYAASAYGRPVHGQPPHDQSYGQSYGQSHGQPWAPVAPAPNAYGRGLPPREEPQEETYLIGDYVDPGRRKAGPAQGEPPSPWSSPL